MNLGQGFGSMMGVLGRANEVPGGVKRNTVEEIGGINGNAQI